MHLIKWKRVDAARYEQMRDILPPELQTSMGFLVGEPWRHRTCNVTGVDWCPAFAAFVNLSGCYYEATGPMTSAEFRCVTAGYVLTNLDETTPQGITIH